jgi:hypothetical protein
VLLPQLYPTVPEYATSHTRIKSDQVPYAPCAVWGHLHEGYSYFQGGEYIVPFGLDASEREHLTTLGNSVITPISREEWRL